MVSVPKKLAIAGAIVVVVIAGIGGFRIHEHARQGSSPPSPEEYAFSAVTRMASGLNATPARVRKVRAQVERETRHAPDYAATYDALSTATKELGGVHSSFLEPSEARQIFGMTDSGTSATNATVFTQDGITTIHIPQLASNDDAVTKRWIRTLSQRLVAARPATTTGWIVDLRGNPGGNIWPMLAGVAPLLTDGHVMSFDSTSHSEAVTVNRDQVMLNGKQEARAPDTIPKSGLPVAVLLGRSTASSAEGVAIAFVGQPGTRSFGQPSAGLSTANTPIRLRDGAVVNLTNAVEVDRTGKRYGIPVIPDVQSNQAALDAARWLNAHKAPPS